MVRRVEEAVSGAYAPGRLIGLLGGEHSITVGAVRALRRVYPELSVLYLDAHADLRDEYMGTRWDHASVARRLRELCPVVQLGVRSASEEEVVLIRESDWPVFFWEGSPDIDELVATALDGLSPQVYVSIDLDVFDPSLMSAVGTPEPGGMDWEDATRLLRAVCERRDIVGFDVTELSPREGPEACAFTAARLTYKLIGYATSL